MSPLELALCPLLILNKSPFVFFCAEVINHLNYSRVADDLSDDASYNDPSSPTIYTTLNMLGICFGVFIHITVGSSFHTTIMN